MESVWVGRPNVRNGLKIIGEDGYNEDCNLEEDDAEWLRVASRVRGVIRL